MPKPRLPRAKAAVAGADIKNPQRFRARKAPEVAAAIGPPPSWMNADQSKAWKMFAAELPWLNGSHRAVLEIASVVRARLVAGEDVGVQALNLLRQCLGQLGATPADATKVTMPDGGDEDPEEKFFSRPN